MSTEQSLDPQLIEQTKQQIRALVNEIAQLSKAGLTPQEYYGEFLTRVVSALAAVGGAVWTTNEEGRLSLQYQINFGEARLQERDEDEQAQHAKLLYRVLRSGEGGLMAPHSGAGESDDAANPTDFLLVLGPLKTEVDSLGVVEILQRPDTGLSTQKGYLRFLIQMCELAADFLKGHQLRHFSDRQTLWTQLEDFTHNIHSSLEPKQTAYTVANEARRLIGCDRVSVALRRGRKCRIEAISGQDQFDKRSNIVRLLGVLATEVVAAGDPMWYTGDTSDMAPQIEEAVQEYVDESHSKTVAVIPLKRPRLEPEKDGREKFEEMVEPFFGALIVEQIEDARVPETTTHRVNVVARHAATALGNAREYSDIFLMPLWRAIGKARWLVQARTLPKVVAISAGILAAILFLVFFPADFDLHGKGTLEPEIRRDVFAKIEGTVDELLVNHNDRVQKDQLLGKLRNTALDVQITETTGQLAATREDISTTQRQLLDDRSRMTPDEHSQKAGKLLELRKTFESLSSKAELLRKQQEDLKILSPIDGTVITWDLYKLLMNRPVQRGQVLMRVGNFEGEWQLEVNMSEDRMGHITRAQHEFGPNLDVTYILASEPGVRHQGKVKEIHQSAELKGEEGSTVLIKVAIDKKDLPLLRPGTTITARVHCGRRSIGYVWFHDLVAFIQSRVFFKLF